MNGNISENEISFHYADYSDNNKKEAKTASSEGERDG